MKVKKLVVSKNDKLTLPGIYESSGTGLSIEVELEEGEDEQAALNAAKSRLEQLYWPLLAFDLQSYMRRVKMGTIEFLQEKNRG